MKKIRACLYLFLLFSFFVPLLAQAKVFKPLVPCGKANPCQFCHLFVMLDNIFDLIIYGLMPVLAVLRLSIAGTRLLLSGGRPDAMARAMRDVTNTLLIVGLVLAGWLIINTILSLIGVVDWTGLKNGGWSIINCPLSP